MPSLHTHLDTRSRSGRGAHPSLWLGTIVNITASAVWVRVPQLAQDDIQANSVIAGHLAPGDRVVVGLMEGRVDNIVVLAKQDPTIAPHHHLVCESCGQVSDGCGGVHDVASARSYLAAGASAVQVGTALLHEARVVRLAQEHVAAVGRGHQDPRALALRARAGSDLRWARVTRTRAPPSS